MQDRTLNYWKKRVFLLCWLAYTLAYLGRINLSVAIPLMENSLALDKTSLGFIGSVFFWVYAFGQLINGRLGDKFACRDFVFVGLFFSAILNTLFGFTTNLFIMTILWAFNGYCQSMLWGPLMRTINQWFPSEQKSKIALYMFSSVVSGFLLTWGCLGQLSSYTGWKGMFWIPGIVLITYSVIWYLFVRNNPGEVGLGLHYVDIKERTEDKELEDTAIENTQSSPQSASRTNNNENRSSSIFSLISRPELYLIALAGIPLGFIREGISLWSPTMLYETFQLNLQSTMGAALLIPLFNFAGVIAARLLIAKFYNKETNLVFIFFVCGLFGCIFLYFFGDSNIIVNLTLIAMCSLSFYGASSIITSVIPLKYNMTSSIAGFLDFSIYLGAGLSGIVTGFLSNKIGWNFVVLLWVMAGTAGGTCVYMAGKTKVKMKPQ
jgi:sugar phosphate permease